MASGWLDRHFKLTERNTTVWTEVRAGVVTFLTMSYILLVNPQILAQVGYPASQVVVATALSSAVASITCGFFGNLPFGLAPGTGLSVYLTYGLYMTGTLTKEQAMATCLLSGILMGIFALIGVTNLVQKGTPFAIKLATVVGMGLLIALIGMVSIKIVVSNPQTLVSVGNVGDIKILISLAGLVLTGSLIFHQVTGSILIGIIAVTLVVWWLEDAWPTQILNVPTLTQNVLEGVDWRHLPPAMGGAIVAFIFVGIFDISGVMFGMGRLAKLTETDHDEVPGGSASAGGTCIEQGMTHEGLILSFCWSYVGNSQWAFFGAALGSIVGAMTGSTPVIVQVETAAGIKEGGRTGLTAITIGVLFLCSVFLAPLFGKVPQTATAPILILVGAMMMGESSKIDWADMREAVPAFFTTVMMPFSYSITNGILFGIIMSIAFFFTTGNFLAYVRQYRKLPEDANADNGERGGVPAEPMGTPLFDNRRMERRPSLLLAKVDYE